MLVRDLDSLTTIWKLAASDTMTKAITLYFAGPNKVVGASLLSAHCRALRRHSRGSSVVKMAALSRAEEILVDGGMLTGILSLMQEDDEIEIDTTKAGLVLKTPSRRAALRLLGTRGPEVILDPSPSVKVDAGALRVAMPFLRGCVAESGMPLLSGVRVSAVNKGLMLTATDALRAGVVRIPAMKGIEGEAVIPAQELAAAIDVLGDEVSLFYTEGAAYLTDGPTDIWISLLQSDRKFPSISAFPRPSAYQYRIDDFPSGEIAGAIRAANILDADKMVTINIRDRQMSLIVSGQETGAFRVAMGERKAADIAIVCDASRLEPVLQLGDEVTLCYNDARGAILFTSQAKPDYLFWCLPIVPAS